MATKEGLLAPADEPAAAGNKFGGGASMGVSAGPDAEALLRQGFVRKVYGILGAQMIVTFLLIAAFQTSFLDRSMKECVEVQCSGQSTSLDDTVKCLKPNCDGKGAECANPAVSSVTLSAAVAVEYQDDSTKCPGGIVSIVDGAYKGIGSDGNGRYFVQMPTATLYAVNYVGYFVGLAAIIVLCCCYESYGRRYPHNYILLSTFTVAEGFMLASACATYDLEIILTAAGMTAGITVALTLFAFQTKIDFTVMNQCLYIALNVFWMWGLFGWFGFLPAGTYKFYLLFGVLLFGFYLVYDTQLIIGGQHKRMQFDMDDYVLAALSIYLDIINLFILILRLLNDSRR